VCAVNIDSVQYRVCASSSTFAQNLQFPFVLIAKLLKNVL